MDARSAAFLYLLAACAPAWAAGLEGLSWERQASSVGRVIADSFRRSETLRPERPARRYDCGSPDVEVYSEDPDDAASACEGFRRAAGFMGDRGWGPRKPLVIHMGRFPDRYTQAKNPDGSPRYELDNMYGFYDSDTGEVFMKPYSRFSRLSAERMLMGMAPSRELYASYVAHEAAHHMSILGYGGEGKIPRVQTEFLSYVVQMETLDPARREEVVRRFREAGGGSIDSTAQIDEMLYAADPQGFTVKSWLYFKGPEGEKTLGEIMAGKLRDPSGF